MKEIKTYDENHFYFGDYLVDLVVIESFRSGFCTNASIGGRVNPLWAKIHNVNMAKNMLQSVALSLHRQSYWPSKPETIASWQTRVPQYLKILREAGMKIPQEVFEDNT